MELYEDSDLTDLDDSGDEFQASTSTSQKKPGVGLNTTKRALKAPRATTYTAQAIFEQIHNQDIDLDAEYQRDVVWPDSKQISLIDSIYRNFYVPPVIFATKTHEDGSETKICIDGKQRLTSIRRFMDGLIPHKDPVTAEKLWYKDMPTGKRRKIIPDKLRRVFAGKQIVCVEYQDITENDEREIFQRVQLGMALTPAEKLQVINTPRVAFVRSLQNLHIKDGGLSSANLEWDSSRGGDFRCLAQALWLIDKYSPSIKNAGSISQLEKWLSITSPLSASFTDKALDTYRIFSELVQHPTWGKPLKDKTKSSGKVSPIEFICVSLLISVYRTKMSMAQLSAAIAGLRDDVRSTHVDIRMNNRVAKTMLDYVRGIKPGAPDGPVAAEYTASLESGANGKGKGKAKRKRGKAGDDDDDDGDESEYEEPLKIRLKMGKAPATTAALPAPPPTLPPKPQAPPTTVVKSEPSLPSLPSRPSASAASTSSRLAALRSIPRIPRYEAPTQPASMSSTAPSTYSMHSSVIPHAQQLPTPSPGQTYTYPSALSAVVGGHQPGYGSSSGYGGSGYDSRSSSAYASRDVQGTQYRAEPRDLGPVHPSRQGNIVAGGAGGGSSDRRNSSGSGYYRESDAGWRR